MVAQEMWRNGVPESMCGRRRHKDNPNEIYYSFEEWLMYPVVIITCGSLATRPAGRVGEDHQDPMPLVVASGDRPMGALDRPMGGPDRTNNP